VKEFEILFLTVSVCKGRASLVGHSRPGRLRPTAAAVLSRLGRDRHVLRHRQPGQFGEHHGEVAARGASLLSESARGARGQQEGPAQRRVHAPRAGEDEEGAGEV